MKTITHKQLSEIFGFTTGPWSSCKSFIGAKSADFVKTDGNKYDGMHIHNGEKRFGVSTKESESNAKLISLAPDILLILINEGLRLEEICSSCIYSFDSPDCNQCTTNIFFQFMQIKAICQTLGKTWEEVMEGLKE